MINSGVKVDVYNCHLSSILICLPSTNIFNIGEIFDSLGDCSNVKVNSEGIDVVTGPVITGNS